MQRLEGVRRPDEEFCSSSARVSVERNQHQSRSRCGPSPGVAAGTDAGTRTGAGIGPVLSAGTRDGSAAAAKNNEAVVRLCGMVKRCVLNGSKEGLIWRHNGVGQAPRVDLEILHSSHQIYVGDRAVVDL